MKKNCTIQWKCLLAVLATALLMPSLYAQNISVRGVVVDGDKLPVIGAAVIDAANKTAGAVTGIDGSFTINVAKDGKLTVECLGFKTKTVPVAGQSSLNIVLEADYTALEEVVVVGYGTMRKKDLTGAVSPVKSDAFEDRPVTNIGQALQGRAAGVYIVDSGNPQDNVSLKIRGIGTINNSDPLYVIDGVPMSIMGMNSLNPEDIEAVDILKDASATAIYGARGANGVVMITTRQGKKGEGKLSLSANFGISMATNMPELLNASQYAALNNQMMTEYGYDANPDWADPTTLGKGTDWLKEMLGTAYAQRYTLSYSGGNDKNSYYVSGSYSTHDGIVNSVGYQRATFQYNATNEVKKWLKMTTNLTLSYDDKTNGDYSIKSLLKTPPVISMYTEDGKYNGTGADDNPLWYGSHTNQVGKSNINQNKTNGYNLLGTQTAEFSIVKGLKFKTVGSIGATFTSTETFKPAYDWKPNPLPESQRYKKSERIFSFLFDNYFTYNEIFGLHSINAMAGSSLQWGKRDWFSGLMSGFLSDSASQFNNGTEIESLQGTRTSWAIASFMGRINYSYDDRYMVTATLRYDGSSKFGPGKRWGLFPSFSAAWRATGEPWFPKNEVLTDLKLRAGYGVTGNQEIGNYSFVSVYETGQYSFNGTVWNSLMSEKLSNNNIHWEEVAQSNVGLDFGFWDNRLTVALDGYVKNTNGMLVSMTVPISSGYSDQKKPYINAGKMRNVGFEFTINSDNLRNKQLRWQTNFNMGFNRNKILSLDKAERLLYAPADLGNGVNFAVNMVGQPVGSFYGYEMVGIFQNQEEVDNWATQVGAAPGDIKFRDQDDTGTINDKDRVIIGNPQPLFTYALGNTFSYKGFDLEIFLQGVYGNTIFNALKADMESMKTICNQFATVLDRWHGEGTSNTMPRAVYGDPNNNVRPSTRYLEDGSYLRLKNLTLGYSLPRKVANKIGMSKLRVYVAANNLFTLTSYSGFDPEVGSNGVDNGTYPITRTISFGLDVNF